MKAVPQDGGAYLIRDSRVEEKERVQMRMKNKAKSKRGSKMGNDWMGE